MLRFSIPFIIGNLLQQIYNIADTFIVGHFLGSNALAAVGSAYAFIVLFTSIILGPVSYTHLDVYKRQMLSFIPVLIVFIFARKSFIEGMTAGAVKG